MAKTITYNSSENTIYADGGSAADPLTPEDIYQEDQAGGWGVSGKLQTEYAGYTAYSFACRVKVGSSAATYWQVHDVRLNVDCLVTEGNTTWDAVDADIVSSHKYYDGSDTEQVDARGFRGDGSFTRCTIRHGWLYWHMSGTLEKCLVQGGSHFIYGSTFDYCNFSDIAFKVKGTPSPTIDTCYFDIFQSEINDADDGEHLVGRDVIIYDGGKLSTYDGQLEAIDPTYLGSCSMAVSKDGDWIEEKFTFARPVVDSSGNPLSGHAVTITDGQGTQVASYTTNASGLPDAEVLLLTRRWENQGGSTVSTDYNPFTVEVQGDGTYRSVTATYAVDEKQTEPIVLRQWPAGPTEGQVESGVSYFEDTRTGRFVGSSHFVGAEVSAPAVAADVTPPTIDAEVS